MLDVEQPLDGESAAWWRGGRCRLLRPAQAEGQTTGQDGQENADAVGHVRPFNAKGKGQPAPLAPATRNRTPDLRS